MLSSHRPSRRRQVQLGLGALLVIALTFWLQGCSQDNPPSATPVATPVKPAVTITIQATVANKVAPTKRPTAVATAKVSKKLTSTAAAKSTPTARPQATAKSAATATWLPTPTNTPATIARAGPLGMAVVTIDKLPPEAQHTVELIKQGGPFPYQRDGIDFQNREGILPRQSRSYYHEYTVITPGSADRGARRIIAGNNGELYYTDDHYATFSWIKQ